MRRPGPTYFAMLIPMMYLICEVNTCTPAPVVKPLTMGSVKKALSDPSLKIPRQSMMKPKEIMILNDFFFGKKKIRNVGSHPFILLTIFLIKDTFREIVVKFDFQLPQLLFTFEKNVFVVIL